MTAVFGHGDEENVHCVCTDVHAARVDQREVYNAYLVSG